MSHRNLRYWLIMVLTSVLLSGHGGSGGISDNNVALFLRRVVMSTNYNTKYRQFLHLRFILHLVVTRYLNMFARTATGLEAR